MSDQIKKWNVAHALEKRKLLIAINCVAGLSIFFFGYDQGMMGGVNNAQDYIELMGIGHTEIVHGSPTPVITNSLLQGGIVSVYYLGTLVSALVGGWVGDKIGRIRTIALGAAWAIVGASLQCSAQNHIWMIFGRFSSKNPRISTNKASSFDQWLWNWNTKRHRPSLGNRKRPSH